MSEQVDLAEFLPAFLGEVGELLSAANQHVLTIEQAQREGGQSPRAVREFFRVVHTIKGLAAMIELEPLVEITHRMETSLRAADRAGGRLTTTSIEPMVQGLRAIEQRVRALATGKQVAPAPRELLQALEQLETAELSATSSATLTLEPELREKLSASELEQLSQGVAAGRRAVRIDFTPSPARSAAGISITTIRERLSSVAELVKVLPQSVAGSGVSFVLLALSAASDQRLKDAVQDYEDLFAIAEPAPVSSLPPGAELEEFEVAEPLMQKRGLLRVESTRLDEALERLGALVVSRSRLERAVAELTSRGVSTRELGALMQENTRILRDLRASFLRLRMVRVSEMLDRVPLVVRSLQRSSEKKVKLVLDVGQAELDKSVADRLLPAIMHLVRNAMDHAVESPDERRAAGKPEESVLRITARARTDSQLELVVADDGRGVEAERLAARAQTELPRSSAELLELLCRPGLSSREEATTTSGRGMGMDIVARIVRNELGGELLLDTRKSQGTTFTLRVPLTISIVDALIFEVNARRYAVAVRTVEEVVEVERERLVRVPRGSGALEMMVRRGRTVPIVALHGLLGEGSREGGASRALIVREGDEMLAFAVDRMLGQQEVVIRPLEDPLLQVKGITGATDLGDGRPTLVLDLAGLSGRKQRGSDARLQGAA